jgi:hypothetical protein
VGARLTCSELHDRAKLIDVAQTDTYRTGVSAPVGDELLVELVYELLDAHDDTARLAADGDALRWQIHLGYLRDLQRAGREILARV